MALEALQLPNNPPTKSPRVSFLLLEQLQSRKLTPTSSFGYRWINEIQPQSLR